MSIKTGTYQSKPKDSASSKAPPAKPISSEVEKIEKLDARLKHISDTIISKSPYILSVPTDQPFQLHHSQRNDWRRGVPRTAFDANEESLQYLSFLPRDFSEDVIKATSGWDNEKGEMIETNSRNAQGRKSGTSTPQSGQAPKKISLAAYKALQSGIKDIPKANGDSSGASATNGVATAPGKATVAISSMQEKGVKRSLDTMQGSEKARTSVLIDRTDVPSKKARTSPAPTSQPTANASVKEGAPARTTLPPLLSPTLPPEIEEELAKAFISPGRITVHKKGDSMTSVSTKMSSLSRLSSPSNSQDLKLPKEAVKSDSKPRSVNKPTPTSQPTKLAEVPNHHSELKQLQGPKKNLESTSPMVGPSSTKPRPPHTPNGARKEPATILLEQEEKPSLIVSLKLPRRIRNDVTRLLNLNQLTKKKEPVIKEKPVQAAQPRPKPQERVQKDKPNGVISQSRYEAGLEFKKSANKVSKPAEKRSRDDDTDADKAPSKRQKPLKVLDSTQKPRTPIPQSFKSPPLPPSVSSQKAQVSTPLREVKTVASRNMDSVDADIKTPQGPVMAGTPHAPNSVGSISREARASSNTSSRSGKSDDINAWRAEHKRYTEMGRTLKHDADDLFKLKAKKDQDELQLEKRGIATALETVLCYILAYTANDETHRFLRKSRDVQTWKSLLPYLQYVKTVTIGYSLLHGLCLQLEAICRNNIQILDFERLERESVPAGTPEETKVLTPDPKADPLQVDAAAKAAQTRSNYIDFKTKMVENARAAQLTWAEGSSELSVDDLQQSFPVSWKKKSRAPLVKAKEKFVASSLGGDFYLPLSNVSLGIEAARAGWSLLGEWCKQNDVKWEGRLGL
ncbi:MAG: hypothetical protein MMC33_006120 [Icmadophila ericetorum]|nr:hypothetical protein [Icmadophila ericetorum]